MKIRTLAATMCLSFLLGTFVQSQLIYPQAWNEIHVGTNYEDVVKSIGKPEAYMGEKGAFWTHWSLTGRQELWIYPSDNKVSMMSIKRCIGTQETFFTQIIHYESKN